MFCYLAVQIPSIQTDTGIIQRYKVNSCYRPTRAIQSIFPNGAVRTESGQSVLANLLALPAFTLDEIRLLTIRRYISSINISPYHSVRILFRYEPFVGSPSGEEWLQQSEIRDGDHIT
jgi:hypothetical protein